MTRGRPPGRMTQRRLKPAPPGFAEVFVRWGWRGVETTFGAHTRCNKRWVRECGGFRLIAERRSYRQRLRQVRGLA